MAARTSAKKGSQKKQPKKTVSGRRGSPSKPTKKTDIRGIIGIILFCLGILMFACQFIPTTGGFLNACRIFQRGLSGKLCILLPLLICACGVILVFFADAPISMRRMVCGLILFLLIGTWFQIANVKNVISNGYGSFLYESYVDSSRAVRGGGLIGALLAWPLYTALDVWGSSIVLFFAAVIVLLVMTGFSFSTMAPSVSEWMDDFRENREMRREERAALREAKEEERLNREAEEAIQRSKRQKPVAAEETDKDLPSHSGPKEQEAEKPASDAGEAIQQEEFVPERTSKGKKKKSSKSGKKQTVSQPAVSAPEPYPEDMPVTANFKPIAGQRSVQYPVQPVNQPYFRQTAHQGYNDLTLYIEREDEFERSAEHLEEDTAVTRGFTQEEAVYAFEHGLNSDMNPGNREAAGEQSAVDSDPGGKSYGDPIPLHPELQIKPETEPDPYEAYRNKNYDTGVAVGYDNEPDQSMEEESSEPDTGASPVPGWAAKETSPATAAEIPGQPNPSFSGESASPFQMAPAMTANAPVKPIRPVPPVEPVMPMPPVAPVPPYEDVRPVAQVAGAGALTAATVYSAGKVAETAETVKQMASTTPLSESGGKRSRRRRPAPQPVQPTEDVRPVQAPQPAAAEPQTREDEPRLFQPAAKPQQVTSAYERQQVSAVQETDEFELDRTHPDGNLPASIPPKGISAVQPKPMMPAENRQNGGYTIVQLRENRLDGTPMVPLPRDQHDSQIAPKPEYIKPSFDLLAESNSSEDPDQRLKDENGMKKLLATLESFGVQARGLTYTHGPAITRYEIQPAPGVKVSRIVNLVDDIALNMASTGVRIEAPIPGKAAVGIEVPNETISMVTLRDVIDTPEMEREKSPTAVALGKGISGKPVIADMAKMPHVLIAGATGSGKSVCINTIINSIIFRASPDEVRLILVDPKVVELSVYNGIPHLLIPVVTDPKKASAALDWAVVEMEHRYKRFESMGVRDIKGYNAAIEPGEPKMYKIIVIIDELADLMMVAPGEVEESICRLAQLARAAGIHLVIATQRPSVNVITGVIKANIPSRIAFAVSSQIDSRTILDTGGAEKLLGKGDMLYAPQGAGKPTRVQGCFVSDAEVERIVKAVKSQSQVEYSDDVMDKINAAAEPDKPQESQESSPGPDSQVDEMLAKAIELAVESGQVSISMLQRRLRVGYARAGRLVDEMTLRGITGEAEGPTKPRQVLISREEWKRMQEAENL